MSAPLSSVLVMTYEDLRPDNVRQVRVMVDGRWRNGELEAHRQNRDGTWRGWVRWSEGVGVTRIEWFGDDAIDGHQMTAHAEMSTFMASATSGLPEATE